MISDDHRGRWGPGMIEVAALLVRLSHVVDGIGQNVRKTSWTLIGKAGEKLAAGAAYVPGDSVDTATVVDIGQAGAV